MIEHPEAVTIAGQIAETLAGKRIESAVRGNAPHRWAFYSYPAEEYAAILKGQSIAGAEPSGSLILVRFGSGHLLVLGGGGERILYHASVDTVPRKHQLLLEFDDDTFLSVNVQGWGSCQLFMPEELQGHKWYANRALEATDKGFTREYFDNLFVTLKPDDTRSVKYFLISEPGIWGTGNGYLQDILLTARVHPRCRAVELREAQRRALHQAIVQTIRRAVRLHGRTDEHDLFGQAGRYERRLSASAAGLPCPACGQAAIVKEAFLGGAIYTCPQCQPAPPKPDRRKAKRKP
jgi:formamidopyrimidine-DNA glycosylase